jgi:hypothetical protein
MEISHMEQKKTELKKKAYLPPKLIIYGDVTVITKGGSTGDFLDQNFSTGTPKGSLTFS